jgi:hypothetical protein
MVWVLEGDDPAVVRIVGQLGGYGPGGELGADGDEVWEVGRPEKPHLKNAMWGTRL